MTFEGRAFAGASPTYEWDFGDGSTGHGTLTPSHTYADNGTYSVTLTVRDDSGGVATDTARVTVASVPPTPRIGGPYAGTVAAPIAFTGSAVDQSPADTAAGFAYRWDFGDGSTSTLASPEHIYAAAGDYRVTLTVRDKDGASSTATASVPVTNYDTSEMVGQMVPNFAAHPTIVSAHSGSWSDPSTWSQGRAPTSGDIVSITGGTVVTYDLVSDVHLDTVAIQPAGELTFRTDVSTRIVVGNFWSFLRAISRSAAWPIPLRRASLRTSSSPTRPSTSIWTRSSLAPA